VTPEGKVKQKVQQWLKDNMPGAWKYAPAGGPFGRGGVPDRIGLWQGVFFAIEVKKDHTNKPTALQLKELRDIQRNGGVAAVLYGFETNKLQRIRDEILRRSQYGIDNETRVREIPVPNQVGPHSVPSSDQDD
jgi:hypothetical protein